jgi:hypothetical protein
MEKSLNTEAGQSELLTFAGIPAENQKLNTNITVHLSKPDAPETTPIRVVGDDYDPGRCVILVPNGGHIHNDCDQALKVLEQRGYTVRRVSGYSQIDVGRNEIASRALLDGFTETMWIDSDIGFDPDAIEKLRRHDVPMVCEIYPKKGQ